MNTFLVVVGVAAMVVLAIATKLAFLFSVGAGVARLAGSDQVSEAGSWRLRAAADHSFRSTDHDECPELSDDVAIALWQFATRDSSSLEIAQRSTTLTVTSADGTTATYGMAGMWIERELKDGIEVRATATSTGEGLILETKVDRHESLQERYVVHPETGVLEVEVRLIAHNSDLLMRAHRVYERSA